MGTLEIDEDLEYQRRFWRIQRVGWALMACVLVAALLGIFGQGPLSHATGGRVGDPLWLEYERFGRYQSTSLLSLHVKGTGSELVAIHFHQDYLSSFRIERIVPEPAQVALSPDGVIYFFTQAGADQSGLVTLYVKPQQIGRLAGRISSADFRPLPVWQWVYP